MDSLTKMDRAAALYAKGASLRQAAKTTGVSYSGLRKWLVTHDIDRRPPGRHLNITKQQTKDILDMYRAENKSLREISKTIGVDRGAVALAIRRAGFMTFNARQMRTRLQERRDHEFSEKVLGMHGDGYPIKEIAAHLRIDARRVRRILKGGAK